MELQKDLMSGVGMKNAPVIKREEHSGSKLIWEIYMNAESTKRFQYPTGKETNTQSMAILP